MNIDQTIKDMFVKLEERKKSVDKLKAETNKGWVTNCTWKVPFTATTINIQTVSEDQLYHLAGHIVSTFNITKFGRYYLKTDNDKEMFNGYHLDDWLADLSKRKATIEIRGEEAKLRDIENRLNAVLSPEERRRIEVEMLAKSLL